MRIIEFKLHLFITEQRTIKLSNYEKHENITVKGQCALIDINLRWRIRRNWLMAQPSIHYTDVWNAAVKINALLKKTLSGVSNSIKLLFGAIFSNLPYMTTVKVLLQDVICVYNNCYYADYSQFSSFNKAKIDYYCYNCKSTITHSSATKSSCHE